jgi:hypothetical protein
MLVISIFGTNAMLLAYLSQPIDFLYNYWIDIKRKHADDPAPLSFSNATLLGFQEQTVVFARGISITLCLEGVT